MSKTGMTGGDTRGVGGGRADLTLGITWLQALIRSLGLMEYRF